MSDESAGQRLSAEPLALPDGTAVWPLIEVRVAELHPTRILLATGQELPIESTAGTAVVLAEYRGSRGGAAALLRRLADEFDYPLRKVAVSDGDLDLRDDRL